MKGTIMCIKPNSGRAVVWSETSDCGMYILRLSNDHNIEIGDEITFDADQSGDVGVVKSFEKHMVASTPQAVM